MNINNVVLAGNLTKNPELRQTKSGTAVCDMRLATNHKRGKTEETLFMSVTVWGPQAEVCSKYLAKGRNVAVQGRLKQDEYVDKEGIKRQSVSLVADSVQFGSRANGESQQNAGEANEPVNEEQPF